MSISKILDKLGLFKTQPENQKVKQDYTMDKTTSTAPPAHSNDLMDLLQHEPLTLSNGNDIHLEESPPTIKIR